MTSEEKTELLSLDFSRIYYRIWLSSPEKESMTPLQMRRYQEMNRLFTERYTLDGGQYLRDLVQRSRDNSGIWEIPKGRKHSSGELALNCAIRETQEETGISPLDYTLLNADPIRLQHTDCGVCYETIYFLAILTNAKRGTSLRLDYSNRSQMAEVAEIRWTSRNVAKQLESSGRLHSTVNAAITALKRCCRISHFTLDLKICQPPTIQEHGKVLSRYSEEEQPICTTHGAAALPEDYTGNSRPNRANLS
jgi:8-oxo-dGTP pyrophosphatase MutT (NUDIX family)